MAAGNEGAEEEKRSEAVSRGPQTGSATTAPESDEQFEQPAGLLDQFYATLRVTHRATYSPHDFQPALAPESPSDGTVHGKIEALFNEKPSWRAAYEIEQLLTLVLTPEQLNTELNRRLAEAADVHLPYAQTLKDLSEKAADDAAKRAVLHRLQNDLQWFYSQRYQRRLAAETLAYRVSRLFLYTFVLFFFVLFMQLAGQPPRDRAADAPTVSAAPTRTPEVGA